MGWLLGDASGVNLARQLGLLLLLEGAVIAILGKAVARGIAFPLFYAIFLVPIGEELVPAMQTLTAQLASMLLALTAIPAHLEGIFITTPGGYFEVAEACAGAKFLIAMLAFGALVANVCYRSWRRRAAFLAVATIVPILANGIRAWGTIYIAEQTSLNFAESFDHVIYGGIFFAVVIAIILGIGWRFFDRGIDEPWFDPKALQPVAPRARAPRPGGRRADRARRARAALVHGGVGQRVVASRPRSLHCPTCRAGSASRRPPASPGARIMPAPTAWSSPIIATRGARIVDLAIAVFARQSEGRELVGFGQGAVVPNGRWAWTADARAAARRTRGTDRLARGGARSAQLLPNRQRPDREPDGGEARNDEGAPARRPAARRRVAGFGRGARRRERRPPGDRRFPARAWARSRRSPTAPPDLTSHVRHRRHLPSRRAQAGRSRAGRGDERTCSPIAGPDGSGIWTAPGIGLGHRRLSIIDLSDAAAQPMLTPDGALAISYNGEIYNFREVRAELEAKGHRFRTESDTEVILAAWRQWGPDCLGRFNGMFAFALYDKGQDALFLARDRLGVKPLFYAELSDGALIFASELKGLLAHPLLRRVPSAQAIEDYFAFGYVPDDASIVEGVQEARRPAISCSSAAAGRCRGRSQWWDVDFSNPVRKSDQGAGRGNGRAPARRRPLAHGRRRAARRLPFGRSRQLGGGRLHGRGEPRGGRDLLDRLRRGRS